MDRFTKSSTPENAKDRWGTPWWLVRALEREINMGRFQLDVCAESRTAKSSRFWTKDDDCLSRPWDEALLHFMNPPYSRGNLGKFLKKAAGESLERSVFVCGVVPDARSSRWWQEYVEGVASVCWLPMKRVAFINVRGEEEKSPPGGTACVLWTPWRTGRTETFRLTRENPK